MTNEEVAKEIICIFDDLSGIPLVAHYRAKAISLITEIVGEQIDYRNRKLTARVEKLRAVLVTAEECPSCDCCSIRARKALKEDDEVWVKK